MNSWLSFPGIFVFWSIVAKKLKKAAYLTDELGNCFTVAKRLPVESIFTLVYRFTSNLKLDNQLLMFKSVFNFSCSKC